MTKLTAALLGALAGYWLARHETPKRACVPPADPHERTRQQLESYLAGVRGRSCSTGCTPVVQACVGSPVPGHGEGENPVPTCRERS
jgi:hypothetical protein